MPPLNQKAPLDGLVVLDLTRWLAGPYCTMLLADAGATVIKVEPPNGGELTRYLEPILKGDEGVSGYFLRLNRRKKSVCLDLRDESDKAAFLDLARTADVVVENFRPGVMDRLGLGQDVLRSENPRLVVASVSGFGATESPFHEWPAFNLTVEAMTGLVQIDSDTGQPKALGPAIGDLVPSLHALSGILMALLRRGVTGEGSFVDIGMFDSCLSLNELAAATASMTGEEFHYGRRVNPNLAPYGLFKAKDGFVCIAVASEVQWVRFCRVIGAEDLLDDTELLIGAGRVNKLDDVIAPRMDAWLMQRTRQEASEALALGGVPSSSVLSALESLNSEQAAARDMVETVVSPDGNSYRIPASPIRMIPPFHLTPSVTVRAGANADQYLGASPHAQEGAR